MDKEQELASYFSICENILDGISNSGFVAERTLLRKLLACMISGGHVLLEGPPGLGKTMLAKVVTLLTGCDYKRVQFTPDMLPADILGAKVWRPKSGNFDFIRGPVFTSLLLTDEINRAPPKTQAALLEAMAERQVTMEGETYPLPKPFFVMATQNPIEQQGTYPLPEAQMDRFALRLSIGYPSTPEQEAAILQARIDRAGEDLPPAIKPITGPEEIMAMQEFCETKVTLQPVMIDYIVRIVRGTRAHKMLEFGCSPRGSVSLLKTARAIALISGRDFLIPDDVKEIAIDLLSHRVIPVQEALFEEDSEKRAIEDVIRQTPAPAKSEFLRGN